MSLKELENIAMDHRVEIYQTSTPGVWGCFIEVPNRLFWHKQYIGFSHSIERAVAEAVKKYKEARK